MPNGGVTKNTFEMSDTNTKLSILYDQQIEIINVTNELRDKDDCQKKFINDQWKSCDERFKSIERRWYKIVGVLVFISILSPVIAAIIQTSL